MKTFFKIISFILFSLFLTITITTVLTGLVANGYLGGFGIFWKGLINFIDSVTKWIVELCGGEYVPLINFF